MALGGRGCTAVSSKVIGHRTASISSGLPSSLPISSHSPGHCSAPNLQDPDTEGGLLRVKRLLLEEVPGEAAASKGSGTPPPPAGPSSREGAGGGKWRGGR